MIFRILLLYIMISILYMLIIEMVGIIMQHEFFFPPQVRIMSYFLWPYFVVYFVIDLYKILFRKDDKDVGLDRSDTEDP